MDLGYFTKTMLRFIYCFLVLSHQDSNLDKQNQNLLCCHYTMRQCVILLEKRGKDRKICLKFYVWRSEKCRIFAIIILRLVENSSFCLVG